MTKTYFTYDPEKGEIVQEATMQKPNLNDYYDQKDWINDNFEYNKHLASLQRYPAPNWLEDLKGIRLEKGVHFRLQKQVLRGDLKTGKTVWLQGIDSQYENFLPKWRRIIAIPITIGTHPETGH